MLERQILNFLCFSQCIACTPAWWILYHVTVNSCKGPISNHISGSSPLGMYKKLVEFYSKGEVSFKYVKTFNMDEYVELPRDHPESYHSFMWENFFKHIDIDPKNAHILDGNAEDLVAECDGYEEKITKAGGIDLFIGGICHFYFPVR